jgi:CheY-like chemotaxis protein
MLQTLGYHADVAATGREALEALERSRYDVVLMDVHMPEMDGLEAARRIVARWPADRRPRLVAMTASALRQDREACQAAGMSEFLSKPVLLRDLEALLGRLAGEGAPAAAASAPPDSPPVLDPVWLERLAELERLSGKALVSVVVAEFQAAAPRRLRELRDALASGEESAGKTVFQVVHGLKGASGNLGASRVAALCLTIEEKTKAGELAPLESLVDALEQELAASSAAMEQWLAAAASARMVPS